MKINVEMNALSHVSEEFAHQALFFFAVVVLDVVQLSQKLSRATDHSEKVGSFPPTKGSPARHFSYSVDMILPCI